MAMKLSDFVFRAGFAGSTGAIECLDCAAVYELVDYDMLSSIAEEAKNHDCKNLSKGWK